MARPALSAARGIDIIDLLASAQGRPLTLSEIARRTGINIASCHAVLNVLVERGYLRRDTQGKAYALGPALFAAGQAALAGQTLLSHAEAAARKLFADLGIPVLITATVGEEVVSILSLGGGDHSLMHTGTRRALTPPTGGAFVAWSDDAEIERWAAKSPDRSPAALDALRRGAAAMRERGFEVLLGSPESAGLASKLRSLAAGARDSEAGYLRMGPGMVLLETIEAERSYDVLMIAAPIFNRQGACAFNLCLGPFADPITGSAILTLSERLLADCVAAMQADRAG